MTSFRETAIEHANAASIAANTQQDQWAKTVECHVAVADLFLRLAASEPPPPGRAIGLRSIVGHDAGGEPIYQTLIAQ